MQFCHQLNSSRSSREPNQLLLATRLALRSFTIFIRTLFFVSVSMLGVLGSRFRGHTMSISSIFSLMYREVSGLWPQEHLQGFKITRNSTLSSFTRQVATCGHLPGSNGILLRAKNCIFRPDRLPTATSRSEKTYSNTNSSKFLRPKKFGPGSARLGENFF